MLVQPYETYTNTNSKFLLQKIQETIFIVEQIII